MNLSQDFLYLAALLVLVFGTALAGDCAPSFPERNPDAIYLVHGDGTVTDTRTHLMWKRCSEGQSWDGSTCTGNVSDHTWEEALTLAEGHTFAGHSDWRLPNRNELQSLVETCRTGPAINTPIFPNTPIAYFWSSSPSASHSDYAWHVNFNHGYVNYHYRPNSSHVRLVRAGQ